MGGGDGIGSQDYVMELDIDTWGDEPPKDKGKGKRKVREGTEGIDTDDDISVEVGRDADMDTHRAGRMSLESALEQRVHGSDFDELEIRSRNGMDEYGIEDEFGMDIPIDIDLGIDAGELDISAAPLDREKTPEAIKDTSRVCELPR